MKLVKMGAALLMAATSFSFIQAQTVDEVVNKYVEAIGGKDKLKQVKTIHMESTSQVMGTEGPSVVDIVSGTGYKMVTQANGQTIIMVVTDKGGWQVNPFTGATTPTEMPAELFKQNRTSLDLTGPLYNYAAKGNKVELLGKEANAYKLKVTTADSIESTVFIDAVTYYMTKMVSTAAMMGQTMEVSLTFSNFKKEDLGLVFPHQTEISYGGQFNITTTLNKLDLNKPIDPAIFVMPKS